MSHCRVSADELEHDRQVAAETDQYFRDVQAVAEYIEEGLTKVGVMEPHIVKIEAAIKESVFDESGNPESTINQVAILALTDAAEAGSLMADIMEEAIQQYAIDNFHELKKYV